MKKFYFLFVDLRLTFFAKSQNIGTGAASTDSFAFLEVKNENKGFLPPHMILVADNNPAPVSKPAQGLLVYNLVFAGSAPHNVWPGYYFWSGAKWTPLENKCSNVGDMQYCYGSAWSAIPIGSNGQVLTVVNGIPQWADCPCTSVSMQPSNKQFESYILSSVQAGFGNGADQLLIEDWTVSLNEFTVRQLIKFDLNSISGKVVDSAMLYLYADSTPNNGDKVNPHAGGTNACYIQRITSNWTTFNQYNWNNQPTVTTFNQASIPQRSTAFDDNIIDVTNLVKDMQANGNNGFMIRLQNEQLYNIRQYESSFSTRANKRPKLVVYYH